MSLRSLDRGLAVAGLCTVLLVCSPALAAQTSGRDSAANGAPRPLIEYRAAGGGQLHLGSHAARRAAEARAYAGEAPAAALAAPAPVRTVQSEKLRTVSAAPAATPSRRPAWRRSLAGAATAAKPPAPTAATSTQTMARASLPRDFTAATAEPRSGRRNRSAATQQPMQLHPATTDWATAAAVTSLPLAAVPSDAAMRDAALAAKPMLSDVAFHPRGVLGGEAGASAPAPAALPTIATARPAVAAVPVPPAKPVSVASVAVPPAAMTPPAAAPSAPPVPVDCTSPDVLGTERVLEVAWQGGASYGHVQRHDRLALQPGEFVLTFDDGPNPRNTPLVLDALDAQCVKATFFSVGEMAKWHPATLADVYRRGHTVGTHTDTHPILTSIGTKAAVKQIEDGFAHVNAVLSQQPHNLIPGYAGGAAPFFRFPGLGENHALLEETAKRDIATFSCDVCTEDWKNLTDDQLLKQALSMMEKEGSGIVLLHDIQAKTARVLPQLLAEMKARGWHVVHIVPAGTLANEVAATTVAPSNVQ